MTKQSINLWEDFNLTEKEEQKKPAKPAKIGYCIFSNSCCNPDEPQRYLCCYYCKNKQCPDRCKDDVTKCRLALSTEPERRKSFFKAVEKSDK